MIGTLAGLAGLLLVAGCGGGGGLAVEGPQATALFQRFSGSWVLDHDASDDPTERPGQTMEGQRPSPGVRGGRGGMGPTGGMGRPGGMGGRGGMRGPGAMNPEAMRATLRFAMLRPQRVDLLLTDSTFTVIPETDRRLELPMAGDNVEIRDGDITVEARVQWDGLLPRIERKVQDGGTVTDHLEVVDGSHGQRLLVTRQLDMGRGAGPELHFVYLRADSD